MTWKSVSQASLLPSCGMELVTTMAARKASALHENIFLRVVRFTDHPGMSYPENDGHGHYRVPMGWPNMIDCFRKHR